MLYGEDKVRQMARSILPSTSRHASRARPVIHRAERHRARAATRAMLKDPELWDEGCDEPDVMQREIGVMVRDRRGADKLNHFERWAVKRTREMPAEARLGHLAGVLPPGLIGEHAMTHLEHNPELMSEERQRVEFPWRFRKPRRRYLDDGECARLLRELLEVRDGHRLFNLALKHGTVEVPGQPLTRRRVPAVRLLLGLHDVLPFLAELRRHWVRRTFVDRFLRRFKETRSPELAVGAVGVVTLSAWQYNQWLRR